MTAPRQRTSEPAWCVRQDHRDSGGIRRHISDPVRVGEQRRSGQVSAWLISGNEGPARLLVNAAHAASASVDISLEDAAVLRDGLTVLLRQAGADG